MRHFLFLLLAIVWITVLPAQNDHSHDCYGDLNWDSLRTSLEDIYDRDQGIREEVMSQRSFDASLASKMDRADRQNQREVTKILDEYGWLPSSKIGEKASDALFFVVQHADLKTMQRFFPNLQCQAKQGEAKSTHAAMMEDRILMYRGEKQIYGTQASMIETNGSEKLMIWPLRDPAGVNWRRNMAGFTTTVEENADNLDAGYDPGLGLPQNNK